MVGRLNANSARRRFDALAVLQIKYGGIFPTFRWKKAKPANADLVPGKAVQLLIVPNAAKHFRWLSSRKSRVPLRSVMSADNWKNEYAGHGMWDTLTRADDGSGL